MDVCFYCGKLAAKLEKIGIVLHFWRRIKRGNTAAKASR